MEQAAVVYGLTERAPMTRVELAVLLGLEQSFSIWSPWHEEQICGHEQEGGHELPLLKRSQL